MEQLLKVGGGGRITAIYSDDLSTLFTNDNGKLTIFRASHVEPDKDGHWIADLSPVGGPTLGPYELREMALDAETQWLKSHVIGRVCTCAERSWYGVQHDSACDFAGERNSTQIRLGRMLRRLKKSRRRKML